MKNLRELMVRRRSDAPRVPSYILCNFKLGGTVTDMMEGLTSKNRGTDATPLENCGPAHSRPVFPRLASSAINRLKLPVGCRAVGCFVARRITQEIRHDTDVAARPPKAVCWSYRSPTRRSFPNPFHLGVRQNSREFVARTAGGLLQRPVGASHLLLLGSANANRLTRQSAADRHSTHTHSGEQCIVGEDRAVCSHLQECDDSGSEWHSTRKWSPGSRRHSATGDARRQRTDD